MIEGLGAVEGLPELMLGLSAGVQGRALRWCEEEDADSVAIIAEAGRSDAFVGALELKAGGCNETVLKKRLAGLVAAGPAGRVVST